MAFAHSLRWAMDTLGQLLGVGDLSLTPASVRAGGATQHIQRHQNVPLLMHIGRWLNVRSLENYLQEAVASIALQAVSDEVAARMEKLANLWPIFRSAPKRRWYRFFSRKRQFDASSAHFRGLLRSAGVQI